MLLQNSVLLLGNLFLGKRGLLFERRGIEIWVLMGREVEELWLRKGLDRGIKGILEAGGILNGGGGTMKLLLFVS